MKLIGTVNCEKSDKGLTLLTIRNLTIPLRGIADEFAGQRVCVCGEPRWAADIGSYFRVTGCWVTTDPDQNAVDVEGTIINIYPERKNNRNRRSACILLQQSRAPSSTVLVTALSSNVDDMQPDNLSIGMRIRIGGYISFHGKGLHILYMRTLNKEGNKNVGQVQKP